VARAGPRSSTVNVTVASWKQNEQNNASSDGLLFYSTINPTYVRMDVPHTVSVNLEVLDGVHVLFSSISRRSGPTETETETETRPLEEPVFLRSITGDNIKSSVSIAPNVNISTVDNVLAVSNVSLSLSATHFPGLNIVLTNQSVLSLGYQRSGASAIFNRVSILSGSKITGVDGVFLTAQEIRLEQNSAITADACADPCWASYFRGAGTSTGTGDGNGLRETGEIRRAWGGGGNLGGAGGGHGGYGLPSMNFLATANSASFLPPETLILPKQRSILFADSALGGVVFDNQNAPLQPGGAGGSVQTASKYYQSKLHEVF